MRILRFNQINESKFEPKLKYTEEQLKDKFLGVSDLFGKEPQIVSYFLYRDHREWWNRYTHINLKGNNGNGLSLSEIRNFDELKSVISLNFSKYNDDDYDEEDTENTTYNGYVTGMKATKINNFSELLDEIKNTVSKLEKEGMDCRVKIGDNFESDFSITIVQSCGDSLKKELDDNLAKLEDIDARLRPIIAEINPNTKVGTRYFKFESDIEGNIIIKLINRDVSTRYYKPFVKKVIAAVAKRANLELTNNLDSGVDPEIVRYIKTSNFSNYEKDGIIKISVK
jgi:hypothetical protein